MSIKTIRKGKHIVFWRDETGRLRNRTVHGEKSKAVALERDIKDQVARKKWDLPNSSNGNCETAEPKTYQEFLIEFCEDHEVVHSRITAKQHLKVGAQLVKSAGARPLTDYSTSDFLSLRKKMLKRGLAAETVNKAIGQLRTQFQMALDLELIAKNPAASGLLKRLKGQSKARRALGLSQIQDIVSHADRPYNHILTICYTTGMRVGEIYRLMIEDVYGDTVIVGKSKNKTTRQIPLLKDARKAIETLRGNRTSGRLILTHKHYQSFKAHLATNLKIAYYRSVHGENPPYRTRNWIQKNVPNITTQDLRHSLISLLRANNVDSELRAKIAGHSKRVDESIYTHYGDETLRNAMSGVFDQKKGIDSETLGVCRSLLNHETVSPFSDTSLASLRNLHTRIGELLEDHTTSTSFLCNSGQSLKDVVHTLYGSDSPLNKNGSQDL